MCQPFAISARRVKGTVRPEATSRGEPPPTRVHLTGRTDSSSAAPEGAYADVAVAAVRGSNRTYASLFMRSQIYTAGGAIPAIPTHQLLPCSSLHPVSVIPHSPFFFESWYNVGRTVTLSIIGFLSLIALLRVSGKRTLSKLNVFDFVFVVAVGSIFAASILEKDVTLIEGIAALATLVGMQIGLAELAARSELAERIINGEPALLLSHGRFIPRALKRERVTEEEVRAAIRAKGVTRVEDVDAVVLENDGTLTVAWTSKESGAKTALVDAKTATGDKPEERRSEADR